MDDTAWMVVGSAIAILVAIGASFREFCLARAAGVAGRAPVESPPGRCRRRPGIAAPHAHPLLVATVAAVVLAAPPAASGQWGPWEVAESDGAAFAVGCSSTDPLGNWVCITVDADQDVEIFGDQIEIWRTVTLSVDGGEVFVDIDVGPANGTQLARWEGQRAGQLIAVLRAGREAFIVRSHTDPRTGRESRRAVDLIVGLDGAERAINAVLPR